MARLLLHVGDCTAEERTAAMVTVMGARAVGHLARHDWVKGRRTDPIGRGKHGSDVSFVLSELEVPRKARGISFVLLSFFWRFCIQAPVQFLYLLKLSTHFP